MRAKWLVGGYSEEGQAVVLVVYHADVVSGELVSGDETSGARCFGQTRCRKTGPPEGI